MLLSTKQLKRLFFLIFILVLVFDLSFFIYCRLNTCNPQVQYARDWHYRYSRDNIINKTEDEIIAKYGVFDKVWTTDQNDYTIAGYLIEPDTGGFYNADYPVYNNIIFQNDGTTKNVSACLLMW